MQIFETILASIVVVPFSLLFSNIGRLFLFVSFIVGISFGLQKKKNSKIRLYLVGITGFMVGFSVTYLLFQSIDCFQHCEGIHTFDIFSETIGGLETSFLGIFVLQVGQIIGVLFSKKRSN